MEQNNRSKKPGYYGHRQRVKEKFLKYGAEPFADYELLELMLFYAKARTDTKPLAHELIDRFGSLRAVLDAPEEELKKTVGVADNTAALLKLFVAVMGRYQQEETELGVIVSSTEEAADILRPYFVGAQVETIFMLSIDAKGKLLGCDRISQGAVDEVLMDQRRVVEAAIHRRASQVVLAHCHISGLAAPSRADILATNRLRQALILLNIRLNDHLVFADGDYVSMVQSGMIEGYR